MSLSPGARLGPYEIIAPLGAGGMGEVYRARDTRLDRPVAIKVLPPHLSSRPELRIRFEREARAVSSLNHPHICTLHDIGSQEGIDYLVMELIEGETLAARLQKGPMPIPELLRCAVQIADALDKAHRQGFAHRDLKPSNIMLARGGAKLLDFGLAKTMGAHEPSQLTASPTMTSPLTAEGAIVGTFQYMAPEQLEGQEADARSDIFSFGAVLYEMITGRRAFDGKTQASVIAGILEREPPPISAIQPLAPPALGRLVKQCLAKDPVDRWQSAGDLKRELEWLIEGGSQAGVPATATVRHRSHERAGWILAGVFLVTLLALLPWTLARWRETPENKPLLRMSLVPPDKTTYGVGFALSPNGKHLAFVAVAGGGPSLWLRSMDASEGRPLAGTEGATLPFWSPDSRHVGFFGGGKLRKIDVVTGTVQILCDALDGRGGTWGTGGAILMAPHFSTPIYRVPASGGVPVQVTRLDEGRGETSHRWPSFLPDGRHFLFSLRTGQKETSKVFLGRLGSDERKDLLTGVSSVQYAPPGYLLFVRDEALLAQPFDTASLELTGEPMLLAESALQYGELGPTGYGSFSASSTGLLAFQKDIGISTQLVWFDRNGKRLGEASPIGQYDEPSLSPDGLRVAVNRTESRGKANDLWILETVRGTFSRLSFTPTQEATPIWSPDGDRIVYGANRTGTFDLAWKLASGAGEEEILIASMTNKWPDDWSRDGKLILFEDFSPTTSTDLWLLPTSGPRTPRVYLNTAASELHGQFSPDGRHVAYTSDESGRPEVYVQTMPASGGKWQVSTGGGGWASWSTDGRAIYFVTPEMGLMAVPVTTGSGFHAGIPQLMFKLDAPNLGFLNSRNAYAITPDGGKVLVNTQASGAIPLPTELMVNWTEALGGK